MLAIEHQRKAMLAIDHQRKQPKPHRRDLPRQEESHDPGSYEQIEQWEIDRRLDLGATTEPKRFPAWPISQAFNWTDCSQI